MSIESSARGSVSGSVLNTLGTRLPGALVVITSLESGTTTEVVSGERGVFHAGRLAQGKYSLRAESRGFKEFALPLIEVFPGRDTAVVVHMDPLVRVEEQVTVIGVAHSNSLEAVEIRESMVPDLGEALGGMPGVWKIRRAGIAADSAVRGFQGRNVTVLIDGQRVYGACPNSMDPSVFHVDFAEVERVDLLKGPFDIRSQGGIGGALNVVTRNPVDGFSGGANLAIGSFRFFNPALDLSYAGDSISVLGGFSFRSADPYRDGSGVPFTDAVDYTEEGRRQDAFEVGTFWGKAGFRLGERHRFKLSYARQEADNVLYPYLKMDAEYDNTNRIGLRYELGRPVERLDRFSVQLYYTEVNHWMTDRFRTTSAIGQRDYGMGTMADTRAVGGRVEAGLDSWTFGFEAYGRFWGAFTELAMMQYRPQFSIPDVSTSGFGAFAEYREQLSEKLTLSGGLRVDRVEMQADSNRANTALYRAYHGREDLSQTNQYPSGNLRLEYRLADQLEFGIGFGSVSQVPEPSERYFALKRMDTDWVGNPGLQPTRNNAVEASVHVHRPRVLIEFAGFHYWLGDYVILYDQQRLSMEAGVLNQMARTYTNAVARMHGAEARLVVPLDDRLLFAADLSYVRGVLEPVAEKQLASTNMAEVPPLRSRLGLRFDNRHFFGLFEGVISAAQSNVNAELGEEKTPSWGIVNLQGGFRHGSHRVTLGVQNLLNHTYFEHLSYQRDPFRSGLRVNEPGRRFFVNLTVGF
ncbi:MAG: TonB-dependent receptor [Acidobacteriota bacterium]|nr:MAG: TonB-dependent receptor [Acidobacteriota bacterium]